MTSSRCLYLFLVNCLPFIFKQSPVVKAFCLPLLLSPWQSSRKSHGCTTKKQQLGWPSLRQAARSVTASPSDQEAISSDRAPSWEALSKQLLETSSTGKRLQQELRLREKGLGPPHVDARLRLFDKTDVADVHVTFYRDSAGWCPYCQKVWIYLEEKRIPYHVETVPLNAYGDKPAWYTRLVDAGKLPAVRLHDKLIVESSDIIEALEEAYPSHEPAMLLSSFPNTDREMKDGSIRLVELEQQLQRDWFSFVFYPLDTERIETAKKNLMKSLLEVNRELGTTDVPWFLDGDAPTVIDLLFVTQMERLVASCLYWRGLRIRNDPSLSNIERWLLAFEKRPSYLATKGDYYSLVQAIPSQNGPGYFSDDAQEMSSLISGLNGGWSLGMEKASVGANAFIQENDEYDSVEARHEAAFCVVQNHEAIVRFAARGAGEIGSPSFHAELADPYAESNMEILDSVDLCMRHVVTALLNGVEHQDEATRLDLAGQAGTGELREGWAEYADEEGIQYFWNEISGDSTWTPPTKQLDTCIAYLRDRVGVPRDMSHASAFHLRCTLNWAIDILNADGLRPSSLP